MSLRNALRQTVARCAPRDTQHATFETDTATSDATEAQQLPAKPCETRDASATSYATAAQLDASDTATGEKLRVAFAYPRNTQPGPLTAHRLLGDLLAAAMRACDHWGDSQQAREQMRRECLETPPSQRADLLAHFNDQYRKATK